MQIVNILKYVILANRNICICGFLLLRDKLEALRHLFKSWKAVLMKSILVSRLIFSNLMLFRWVSLQLFMISSTYGDSSIWEWLMQTDLQLIRISSSSFWKTMGISWAGFYRWTIKCAVFCPSLLPSGLVFLQPWFSMPVPFPDPFTIESWSKGNNNGCWGSL